MTIKGANTHAGTTCNIVQAGVRAILVERRSRRRQQPLMITPRVGSEGPLPRRSCGCRRCSHRWSMLFESSDLHRIMLSTTSQHSSCPRAKPEDAAAVTLPRLEYSMPSPGNVERARARRVLMRVRVNDRIALQVRAIRLESDCPKNWGWNMGPLAQTPASGEATTRDRKDETAREIDSLEVSASPRSNSRPPQSAPRTDSCRVRTRRARSRGRRRPTRAP